jgi:putative salt-induced outer membrane protein YdiY
VTLGAHYALSYADNEIDDNNARASLLRDWLFPGSRWLGFSYTTYDFDDFEAWEHRVVTGGGPGYRIIPGEPLQLTFRTGPFIGYEFGDEDDARPEYAVGLFNTYKNKRGVKFNLFNAYYQTVDHPEFRNVSTLELRLPLVARGLSLRFGVYNEYDSESEKSKNNLKYQSTLAFDL